MAQFAYFGLLVIANILQAVNAVTLGSIGVMKGSYLAGAAESLCGYFSDKSKWLEKYRRIVSLDALQKGDAAGKRYSESDKNKAAQGVVGGGGQGRQSSNSCRT
ncbi:hypothetical protein HDU83_005287, partial [Entophlyctis luteolus]